MFSGKGSHFIFMRFELLKYVILVWVSPVKRHLAGSHLETGPPVGFFLQLSIGQNPNPACVDTPHLCFRDPQPRWEGGQEAAACGDSLGLGWLQGQESGQV